MADKQEREQQPASGTSYFSDSRWDAALDLMVRRTAYGMLTGGALALFILRKWQGCWVRCLECKEGWVVRSTCGAGTAADPSRVA